MFVSEEFKNGHLMQVDVICIGCYSFEYSYLLDLKEDLRGAVGCSRLDSRCDRLAGAVRSARTRPQALAYIAMACADFCRQLRGTEGCLGLGVSQALLSAFPAE